MTLTGRNILITGASSGIGRSLAADLARRGARLALAARRPAELEAAADAVRAAGGTAVAVPMDVVEETSVVAAFAEAEQALGPISTVYANAGTSDRTAVLDLPMTEFDRVMAVNIRGSFLTAREGVRRMIAAGVADRGRIVMIASIAGLRPLPGVPIYSMSKAAVVMAARALAREWARLGVNVNAVCPGYVETEINTDFLTSEAGRTLVSRFPRRRLLRPEDLHDTLAYLGSDASGGVTGAVFTIDDGQSL